MITSAREKENDMTMNEITNVRNNATIKTQEEKKAWVWEQVQLITLGLTIIGQITVGQWFIFGQALWCAANVTACVRNIMLRRPFADCLKDGVLLAITIGIITAWALGAY